MTISIWLLIFFFVRNIDFNDSDDLDDLALKHQLWEELSQTDDTPQQDVHAAEKSSPSEPPPQLSQACTRYTLHSVIYHHGRRAHSGHYVSVVRKGRNKCKLFVDFNIA